MGERKLIKGRVKVKQYLRNGKLVQGYDQTRADGKARPSKGRRTKRKDEGQKRRRSSGGRRPKGGLPKPVEGLVPREERKPSDGVRGTPSPRFRGKGPSSGKVHDEPMPKLPEGFNALPKEERARLTARWSDVRKELNARIPVQGYNRGSVVGAMNDARDHLGHLVEQGWIAEGNRDRATMIVDRLGESMVSAGVDSKDAAYVLEDTVRKLAHQEHESVRRTLGDHGVRHLSHNIEAMTGIFDALEEGGQKITDQDRLAGIIAQVNHDIGYTIPAIARGGFKVKDNYHPQASAEVFEQQSSGHAAWERVLGSRLNRMDDWIRNHSGTEVDWKRDPVGSAIRVADNTHLFHDKMPEVLFNTPGAMEALVKIALAGKAGMDIAPLKDAMKAKLGDVPEPQRGALEQAIGEISGLTPKFLASRLAGRDATWSYDRKANALTVDVEQSPLRSVIGRVFGPDQADKQFHKLLEDFGVKDPDASKPVELGEEGKGKLVLKWTPPKSEAKGIEQKYKATARRVLREWNRVQDLPEGSRERKQATKAFMGKLAKALEGGLADGMTADDFDADALAQGTAVELEHTDDEEVAREIAMDHLAEDPDYYTKLAKMEKGAAELLDAAAEVGDPDVTRLAEGMVALRSWVDRMFGFLSKGRKPSQADLEGAGQLGMFGTQRVQVKAHTRTSKTGKVTPVKSHPADRAKRSAPEQGKKPDRVRDVWDVVGASFLASLVVDGGEPVLRALQYLVSRGRFTRADVGAVVTAAGLPRGGMDTGNEDGLVRELWTKGQIAPVDGVGKGISKTWTTFEATDRFKAQVAKLSAHLAPSGIVSRTPRYEGAWADQPPELQERVLDDITGAVAKGKHSVPTVYAVKVGPPMSSREEAKRHSRAVARSMLDSGIPLEAVERAAQHGPTLQQHRPMSKRAAPEQGEKEAKPKPHDKPAPSMWSPDQARGWSDQQAIQHLYHAWKSGRVGNEKQARAFVSKVAREADPGNSAVQSYIDVIVQRHFPARNPAKGYTRKTPSEVYAERSRAMSKADPVEVVTVADIERLLKARRASRRELESAGQLGLFGGQRQVAVKPHVRRTSTGKATTVKGHQRTVEAGEGSKIKPREAFRARKRQIDEWMEEHAGHEATVHVLERELQRRAQKRAAKWGDRGKGKRTAKQRLQDADKIGGDEVAAVVQEIQRAEAEGPEPLPPPAEPMEDLYGGDWASTGQYVDRAIEHMQGWLKANARNEWERKLALWSKDFEYAVKDLVAAGGFGMGGAMFSDWTGDRVRNLQRPLDREILRAFRPDTGDAMMGKREFAAWLQDLLPGATFSVTKGDYDREWTGEVRHPDEQYPLARTQTRRKGDAWGPLAGQVADAVAERRAKEAVDELPLVWPKPPHLFPSAYDRMAYREGVARPNRERLAQKRAEQNAKIDETIEAAPKIAQQVNDVFEGTSFSTVAQARKVLPEGWDLRTGTHGDGGYIITLDVPGPHGDYTFQQSVYRQPTKDSYYKGDAQTAAQWAWERVGNGDWTATYLGRHVLTDDGWTVQKDPEAWPTYAAKERAEGRTPAGLPRLHVPTDLYRAEDSRAHETEARHVPLPEVPASKLPRDVVQRGYRYWSQDLAESAGVPAPPPEQAEAFVKQHSGRRGNLRKAREVRILVKARASKRAADTPDKGAHPEIDVGMYCRYHAPDGKVRHGRIDGKGMKGCTIVDGETGEAHKIPFGYFAVTSAPTTSKETG